MKIAFWINDLQRFFFAEVAFWPGSEGIPALFVAKARQAWHGFQ
jgi:hypothetical protein